jgi:hypothetical protein
MSKAIPNAWNRAARICYESPDYDLSPAPIKHVSFQGFTFLLIQDRSGSQLLLPDNFGIHIFANQDGDW